jgi:hypothetical protein
VLSVTASKTKFNLRSANMPVTNFGLIVGVTPSTMRSAMSGVLYLGTGMEEAHYQTSCRILALAEAMKPLQLNDWQVWKQLLESGVEPGAIKSWVQIHFGDRE